jgi:hypothetical protein
MLFSPIMAIVVAAIAPSFGIRRNRALAVSRSG